MENQFKIQTLNLEIMIKKAISNFLVKEMTKARSELLKEYQELKTIVTNYEHAYLELNSEFTPEKINHQEVNAFVEFCKSFLKIKTLYSKIILINNPRNVFWTDNEEKESVVIDVNEFETSSEGEFDFTRLAEKHTIENLNNFTLVSSTYRFKTYYNSNHTTGEKFIKQEIIVKSKDGKMQIELSNDKLIITIDNVSLSFRNNNFCLDYGTNSLILERETIYHSPENKTITSYKLFNGYTGYPRYPSSRSKEVPITFMYYINKFMKSVKAELQ